MYDWQPHRVRQLLSWQVACEAAHALQGGAMVCCTQMFEGARVLHSQHKLSHLNTMACHNRSMDLGSRFPEFCMCTAVSAADMARDVWGEPQADLQHQHSIPWRHSTM